ncbi:MAG TPA: DUF1178 family protein [Hyphomicrobiales bacterium]|nr:DUF1178 family protein [Hyphomicrobiales bacterium]
MIRYDLVCAGGHRFDGWFRSSGDFDAQAARRLLSCAVCGSGEVTKALMAPAVATGSAAPAAEPASPPAAPAQEVALVSDEHRRLRRMLVELRAELVKDAVDVGDRFPEEARKIHYGEAEKASIYGRASPEEARRLAEEGVAFHPLPTLPDEQN